MKVGKCLKEWIHGRPSSAHGGIREMFRCLSRLPPEHRGWLSPASMQEHVFAGEYPFQQVKIWIGRFHDAPLGCSSIRILCIQRAHWIPFPVSCSALRRGEASLKRARFPAPTTASADPAGTGQASCPVTSAIAGGRAAPRTGTACRSGLPG